MVVEKLKPIESETNVGTSQYQQAEIKRHIIQRTTKVDMNLDPVILPNKLLPNLLTHGDTVAVKDKDNEIAVEVFITRLGKVTIQTQFEDIKYQNYSFISQRYSVMGEWFLWVLIPYIN